MSEEPRAWAAARPAGSADASGDHWDLVRGELRRRRLFRLGVAVLALLYASAIYAPLLANDRPLFLRAVDHGAYERARRSLPAVALGLRGLVARTPEEYEEARVEGSSLAWEGALAAEVSALGTRAELLASHLPRDRRGVLRELEREAESVVELARAGRRQDALGRAEALAASAREASRRLEARRPGEAVGEGAGGGVELVPRATFPLLASLGPWEVFFMVLWAGVLSWPLWNRLVDRRLLGGDRARIRRWRRGKLVLLLAPALVVALAWRLVAGEPGALHGAGFKAALSSGEIVAERVLFPPIPFGFAETHMEERFRPPTWRPEAEISEEGHYVRGPRRPEPDPVTGFVQEPSPVDVRFGEPAANAPLRHPLGTDGLGRDVLARALWGGRVSLSVGLVATAILVVIGVLVGCTAGWLGGRADLLISRFIEVVLCFPVFFLILVVVAFVGPSIPTIMVVIGLVRWTGIARLGRGEFLRLKEEEFVVAARALGLPAWRIVLRHVLPNALGPLIVAATFSVAAGILVETALSFLGFGIRMPIPSWGSLVNESRSASNWWVQVFPGLLIFATVLCYNLVGDAVRDAMDPKQEARR